MKTSKKKGTKKHASKKTIKNISTTQKKSKKSVWFVLLAAVLIIAALFAIQMSINEQKEIVVFETSKGIIEVELDRANAPITVENFVSYVNAKHYDGLVFHRVIKGFMVQGGGFDANAEQKVTQPPIKLESNNGLKNVRGTVAMARTNVADSATSQFFINTVDNGFLDYAPRNDGYAVFGKVVMGMEVVDAIEGVATAQRGFHGDWPVEDVIIQKAYMKE